MHKKINVNLLLITCFAFGAGFWVVVLTPLLCRLRVIVSSVALSNLNSATDR